MPFLKINHYNHDISLEKWSEIKIFRRSINTFSMYSLIRLCYVHCTALCIILMNFTEMAATFICTGNLPIQCTVYNISCTKNETNNFFRIYQFCYWIWYLTFEYTVRNRMNIIQNMYGNKRVNQSHRKTNFPEIYPKNDIILLLSHHYCKLFVYDILLTCTACLPSYFWFMLILFLTVYSKMATVLQVVLCTL